MVMDNQDELQINSNFARKVMSIWAMSWYGQNIAV